MTIPETQQEIARLENEISALFRKISDLRFERNYLIKTVRACTHCGVLKFSKAFHENAGNRCKQCKSKQDRLRYRSRKAA